MVVLYYSGGFQSVSRATQNFLKQCFYYLKCVYIFDPIKEIVNEEIRAHIVFFKEA